MAQNTNYDTQTGAPALLQKVQVYQYTVDTSTVDGDDSKNLAIGAHVEMIQLEAGDLVVSGAVEVVTVDAGGGTIDIGIGGTGTELVAAQALSTAGVFAIDTTDVVIGADTVDLSTNTAAVTTAVIRVTLAVLKAGDFTG